MDYDAFLIQMGKRIKELRLQRQLSQEEVSGLDMGVRVYQRIEQGQTNANLRTLFKIAMALNVQPRDLLPNVPAEKETKAKRKN
jgi:transcriptional regulator with XRE-family HTH domain